MVIEKSHVDSGGGDSPDLSNYGWRVCWIDLRFQKANLVNKVIDLRARESSINFQWVMIGQYVL